MVKTSNQKFLLQQINHYGFREHPSLSILDFNPRHLLELKASYHKVMQNPLHPITLESLKLKSRLLAKGIIPHTSQMLNLATDAMYPDR